MALDFNGTLINESTGSVNFNGATVDKVMLNNVQLWAKSVSLNWSDSSQVNYTGAGLSGMETTGSLMRYKINGTAGSYITFNSTTGYFSGTSSVYENYIQASNNLLRLKDSSASVGAWVTFTLTTKSFSGKSISKEYGENVDLWIGTGLETASGQIRFGAYNRSAIWVTGSYIRLK